MPTLSAIGGPQVAWQGTIANVNNVGIGYASGDTVHDQYNGAYTISSVTSGQVNSVLTTVQPTAIGAFPDPLIICQATSTTGSGLTLYATWASQGVILTNPAAPSIAGAGLLQPLTQAISGTTIATLATAAITSGHSVSVTATVSNAPSPVAFINVMPTVYPGSGLSWSATLASTTLTIYVWNSTNASITPATGVAFNYEITPA